MCKFYKLFVYLCTESNRICFCYFLYKKQKWTIAQQTLTWSMNGMKFASDWRILKEELWWAYQMVQEPLCRTMSKPTFFLKHFYGGGEGYWNGLYACENNDNCDVSCMWSTLEHNHMKWRNMNELLKTNFDRSFHQSPLLPTSTPSSLIPWYVWVKMLVRPPTTPNVNPLRPALRWLLLLPSWDSRILLLISSCWLSMITVPSVLDKEPVTCIESLK